MKQVPAAIRKVYRAVSAPGITQSQGQWQEDGRCCVGSRLAHALGVASGNFLDGADAWAREMGGNRAHVILMLKRAGAGLDPLGPGDWPTSPREVWANLSGEAELPLLAYANLGGADLRGADLRNADFTGANLVGADLTCADLRGADLRRADLYGTDLTGADLRGACLDDVNLEQVTLNETTLLDDEVLPPPIPSGSGHISD